MNDKKDKKPSIFEKAVDAGHSWLDLQIKKASGDLQNKKEQDDAEFVYGKSITDEPSYAINSQGYKDKPHRILNSHLKQMALKNSVVAAVIQTRQNQVSNHSRLVKSEQDRGFIVRLKDEESFLQEIKEEIEAENGKSEDKEDEVKKSDEIVSDQENEEGGILTENDADDENSDDVNEEYNWEIERKARERLELQIRKRRKSVEDFILGCGVLKQRPFETKKWNFDSALRAWTRDTLTYDFISTELVPDQKGDPHHFFPTDASTMRFSSPSLKKYKAFPGAQTNVDLLYPEKQIEALENSDALELDEKLLDDDAYKYVQVIRGRIERAYTEDEMKIGMRNNTTDIYNNGYSVAELELLVSLVSSHLNTEYYNKAYFTQGFSAKGILHLKAPIPKRKLETIRQKWHHMIRGNRNSFQTPIFAGMDEVNWIPLTQNHSDIEFAGWMNYLIKMICSIYQIDPFEVGIGMKDEGSRGGISGDNTEEKINQSKDKGLYPLLRFLENYVNVNIIDMIDSDFCIQFTGLNEESRKEALERQDKEAKFKKTVNEIRAEDNLPPIPGMDDIILSDVYMNWYDKYSKKGQAVTQQNQQNTDPGNPEIEDGDMTDEEISGLFDVEDGDNVEKSLQKSKNVVKIEYYGTKK